MTVRKIDDIANKGNFQGENSRPLKRIVKAPKDSDGRTIVTGSTRVPNPDGEGYPDTYSDEANDEELAEITETAQPRRGRGSRRLPGRSIKTKGGVLMISTNGTPEGTIVTLDGEKLDVQVILNLTLL